MCQRPLRGVSQPSGAGRPASVGRQPRGPPARAGGAQRQRPGGQGAGGGQWLLGGRRAQGVGIQEEQHPHQHQHPSLLVCARIVV
eukprot:scaffold243680_cov31-Prasinocladus_malaysianus.AAC.1